ncbi:SDR family oxidoreductase [Lacticaseibacillus mingshuiensis]|uniref:SDR family oxidoreductase n=1 Tax=Lacticaseibacillus mingshuiensis TaxID=2799574 RepID=UPI00194EA7CF|nr:SDR family oxidoreductase [Lacticaseibacillus mingshuiensis]
MKLDTQTILIIGGTSGFGAAVAVQAAAQGAKVHVIGRNADRLQIFLASHPELTGTALDATDEAALQAFFTTHATFDHLVSMLGGAASGGFLSDRTAIREAIEGKFFANLQLAQIASPHLLRSMTFTAGSGGHPNDAAGAIVGNQAIATMVQGLGVELAPRLRVNAVSPFWTPTGLWRTMPDAQQKQQADALASSIPLGRVGTIDEVAAAYLFAMTNTFMTGQVLHIDGGVDL